MVRPMTKWLGPRLSGQAHVEVGRPSPVMLHASSPPPPPSASASATHYPGRHGGGREAWSVQAVAGHHAGGRETRSVQAVAGHHGGGRETRCPTRRVFLVRSPCHVCDALSSCHVCDNCSRGRPHNGPCKCLHSTTRTLQMCRPQ